MPRPLPPRLRREFTRHGKTVYYVRPEHEGDRIRIRAEFDTPEFWAEYAAAIGGQPIVLGAKATPRTESLGWLWEQYTQSSAWRDLGQASRDQRDDVIVHVLKEAGNEPFAEIDRADIIAGRDKRAEHPAAAKHFLRTMNGLFDWAVSMNHIEHNPVAGVKPPKTPKSEGFKVWSEEEIEQYEKKWPRGTRERVWLDVLLYTGLRRGDAVRLGKQHLHIGPDGQVEATIRTEKSGFQTEVTIPITPELAATLDAGPIGDLTFVTGKSGNPLRKSSFGILFKQACQTAGIDMAGKAAHGLRKAAATRCADDGRNLHQLMSLFGWESEKQALIYTKTADRRNNARVAASGLSRKRARRSTAEVIAFKKANG